MIDICHNRQPSILQFFPFISSPQTISVSVSVLTLSCIAQDRWYAICHPLKFKSTAKRARRSIVFIWLVSCVIMIPQAIVMECSSLLPVLLPELTNKTSLFTVCDEHWGGEEVATLHHLHTLILMLNELCSSFNHFNKVSFSILIFKGFSIHCHKENKVIHHQFSVIHTL